MKAKKKAAKTLQEADPQFTKGRSNPVKNQSWPVWALALVPLLALPFMLNVRMMTMALPNEQPKWAILIMAAFLLAFALAARLWPQNRLDHVRFSWPGVFLAVFFVLLAIGIGIGPNWVEGVIRFSFWLSALAIWLSVVVAVRTWPGFINWLVWATGISGFIFSLHYWWDYFIEYGSPGYKVSVLFSPIGHVNFTSDVLIILFPALLWVLFTRKEAALRMLVWFSAATCGVILLVASSRGALFGLIAGSLLMLAVIIKHRSNITWRGNTMAWVLLASVLFGAVTVHQTLPYHFRELTRVSASFQGEATGEARIPEQLGPSMAQPPLARLWLTVFPLLGDRTPMYASVSAMIADSPWLGHGSGNFPYIYPKYSNAFPDFRDPMSTEVSYITNPHNVFLQISAQNGLPAAMIFMGLLALFLWRLVVSVWHRWDGLTAVGLAVVAAVIFDAMFNHVFFNPASMFVFALFGGLWWGRLPSGSGLISLTPPKWFFTAPLMLALLLAIWPARWLVSDWYAARAQLAEPSPAIMEPNYRLAAKFNPYNFRAVYGLAKVGFLQKDYDAVIEHLEWMKHIYPYNAAALNMLGVAYMLKGRFPEAEQALFASLQVLPDYDKAQENVRRLQSWATAPAGDRH